MTSDDLALVVVALLLPFQYIAMLILIFSE